jgi:hypothetical protein
MGMKREGLPVHVFVGHEPPDEEVLALLQHGPAEGVGVVMDLDGIRTSLCNL